MQFQTPDHGIYVGGTDTGPVAPEGTWRTVFRLPTGLGDEIEIQPVCYRAGDYPQERPLFRYEPHRYRVTR